MLGSEDTMNADSRIQNIKKKREIQLSLKASHTFAAAFTVGLFIRTFLTRITSVALLQIHSVTHMTCTEQHIAQGKLERTLLD